MMERNTPDPIVSHSARAFSTIAKMTIEDLIDRHRKGDWGNVDAQTQKSNERNRVHGGPRVSIFRCLTEFWITTEADGTVSVLTRIPSAGEIAETPLDAEAPKGLNEEVTTPPY